MLSNTCKKRNRYRAILPEQCMFNFYVALYVLFMYSKPILRFLCHQTHFPPAAPFEKQDLYTICYTFMSIWVTPFLGVSHHSWVDQAKGF